MDGNRMLDEVLSQALEPEAVKAADGPVAKLNVVRAGMPMPQIRDRQQWDLATYTLAMLGHQHSEERLQTGTTLKGLHGNRSTKTKETTRKHTEGSGAIPPHLLVKHSAFRQGRMID
jgi:hypothetical protein